MAPPVPRSLRVVNALAVLLFLVGAGLYVRAWIGMRGLESYESRPDSPVLEGLLRFDHFWNLSRIGIWLVISAVLVAVLAAVAAHVMRDRSDPDGDPGT